MSLTPDDEVIVSGGHMTLLQGCHWVPHAVVDVGNKRLTCSEENPRIVRREAHSTLPDTSLTTLFFENVIHFRLSGWTAFHSIDRSDAHPWRSADCNEHTGVIEKIAVATKPSNNNSI
jgi:hypothetical protein